jgi:hypothetical protein
VALGDFVDVEFSVGLFVALGFSVGLAELFFFFNPSKTGLSGSRALVVVMSASGSSVVVAMSSPLSIVRLHCHVNAGTAAQRVQFEQAQEIAKTPSGSAPPR